MIHDNGGNEMKKLSQSLRVGAFLLCLLFATQMIVPGQASNSDSPELKSADVIRLVIKGYRLASPEAEKLEEKLLADKLFKQLAVADPNNPRWPSELGHLYMLEMQNVTRTPQTEPSRGADKTSLAASAYQNFERAYRLQHHDQEKRILFPELATSAFEAGEIETAQRWALDALNDAATTASDWS